MEQKEKAVLYIALRDAYQKLYTYEAEEQTENKQIELPRAKGMVQ